MGGSGWRVVVFTVLELQYLGLGLRVRCGQGEGGGGCEVGDGE